jgi:hypothetical protein
MGYRCPVCAEPQADDAHLANHLAFTALIRGGDHEDWLDEHVPDWGGMGEERLANTVRDHAESVDYPAVFGDTTGQELGGRHEHGHAGDQGHGQGGPAGWGENGDDRPEMVDPPFGAEMDEETRAAIERARELTRERRANAASDEADDGDEQ